MAKQRKFVGFSSTGNSSNTTLTDLDIVKRDFINHLYTQKGERVMYPEFGTRIYELLFEPFTERVRNEIVKDVKAVAMYDPRIELIDVNVVNLRHGIKIEIKVNYTPWNVTENLNMIFDRRSQESI